MGLFIKGVYVFSLSMVFFYAMTIPVWLYIMMIVALTLLVFYHFDGLLNCQFYQKFRGGVIANIIAFLVAYWIKSNDRELQWIEALCIVLLLEIVPFAPILRTLTYYTQKDKNNPNGSSEQDVKKELYREHCSDFEDMKKRISHTNILGINSTWGNGKTFLVDYFCEKMANKYHVIKIEALTYRYDEFDKVLINKLDELLRENRIFSFYALSFKQALGNSLWGKFIYHYFVGMMPGNSSIITGLANELEKLSEGNPSKDVLIIFENLERVRNKDAVIRMLAIAERLAGKHVKIIYEYDKIKLQENLSLKWKYLEKYIPMEINLSELSYKSMVTDIWNEIKPDEKEANQKNTSNEKTDEGKRDKGENNKGKINKIIRARSASYISTSKNVKDFISSFVDRQYNPFSKNLELGKIGFLGECLSIRRMQQFLADIFGWMQNITEDEIDESIARVVIAFFFFKHFSESIYERLIPLTPLEKIFLFKYENSMETIQSLGKKLWNIPGENQSHDAAIFWANLEKQVKEDENNETLLVYALFGYDFSDLEKRLRYEGKAEKMSFQDGLLLMSSEEKREEINRLIWSLLQSGKSEYSDRIACVNKFEKEILCQSEEKRAQAFKKYCDDLSGGKIYKDNRSILLMGEKPLLSIVRAAFLCNYGTKFWDAMCDYVCAEWNDRNITVELIQLCYFIELNSWKNMRKMIMLFNSRSVVCNFNTYEPYIAFMQKYMCKLCEWGYCSRRTYNFFQQNEWTLFNMKKSSDLCDCLKEELTFLEKDTLLDSKEYVEDIKILVEFIKKNITIIENKQTASNWKPRINIEHHTEYYHQGEMEELIDLIQKSQYSEKLYEDIMRKLEHDYKYSFLNTGEIREIKKVLENKKNR